MLRRLFGENCGAISILSAIAFVAVIGVSALAVEFGYSLLQRTENQRIADLAAYGGALVYNSTGSTTSANGAVSNIVALNGLTSSNATSAIVSSPTGDGNQAMQVTVTTSVPLNLARVLTSSASLSVGATSYAEIKSDAPGCVIALSGSGTGVALTGGATLSANDCAVDFEQRRDRSRLQQHDHDRSRQLQFVYGAAVMFARGAVGDTVGPGQQDDNHRPARRQQRSHRRHQPDQLRLRHHLAERTQRRKQRHL